MVILAGSVLGIVAYAALLLFFSLIILEITALVGVVVLLGILAWIGWTMATTPPPEPIAAMSSGAVSTGGGETRFGSTHVDEAEARK